MASTARDSPPNTQHETCATALVQPYPREPYGFRLLSLPPELRHNIYRYYFVSQIQKYESKYRLVEEDKNCNIYCLKKCNTQILAVNRQLYLEAREVLYSETIWHISFNSFAPNTDLRTVSDASLQAFRSRSEFHYIRNITVGVMFLTVIPDSDLMPTSWTEEDLKRLGLDRNRLEVNRELLKLICETLLQAPNLQTLKILWHDDIEHGLSEEKRDCLGELAGLPEKLICIIFMGLEAAAVHPPMDKVGARRSLTVQEHAAKAELNQYLDTVRRQFQARSQPKSSYGPDTTSLNPVAQPPV